MLWRSISIQNFMAPRSLVHIFHPPQEFERPSFWNGWSYGTKKYGVEVTFDDMNSLLNFIKIYQPVKKLIRGQTHRQEGDLISLRFSFRKESRLKMHLIYFLLYIERRGRILWISAFYWGSSGLKYWFRARLSWLLFSLFSSGPSGKCLDSNLN
jgi:hypothetical protein